MQQSMTTFDVPIAANDNKPWDGRQLLAWPTAKRLAASKRNDDLAMLAGYKRLVDLAYGEPANDNYRNAAPAPGEDDDRGACEVIDEVDRILNESGIKPTIPEMRDASPAWPEDDTTPPPRAQIVAFDVHDGKETCRREFTGKKGGLAFIKGSELLEFKTTASGKWRKPYLVHSHHRNKKTPDASLVPNSSGTWAIEDKIAAMQEWEIICRAIPASSVKVLEIACGPTRAQEIGEAFRKQGKTAERFGVKVIDRALDHLRAVWSPQNAFVA